jgi:hypothetical protein
MSWGRGGSKFITLQQKDVVGVFEKGKGALETLNFFERDLASSKDIASQA